MPEMPDAREDHREAVLVSSSNHLCVAHRTTWLDDSGRARGGNRVEAITEREERV